MEVLEKYVLNGKVKSMLCAREFMMTRPCKAHAENRSGRKQVVHLNMLFQCEFVPSEEVRRPIRRRLSVKVRNAKKNQSESRTMIAR